MRAQIRRFRLDLPALTALAALAAPALLQPPAAAAHGCEGKPIWHADTPADLAEDDGEKRVAASGLWRPEGGAFVAPKLKVPWAAIGAEVGQPGDQRSVRDFAIYASGGQTYFALVFSPQERGEELLPSLAGDSALRDALDSRKAGQHLVDFEPFRQDGQRKWAALFADGARPQNLSFALRADLLEQKVNDEHQQLTNFAVHSSALGKPAFAALFDTGKKGEQKFFADLDAGEVHTQMHDPERGAFRLVRLAAYLDDLGVNHYAALFEKATGDDHLFVQACSENCAAAAAIDATTADLAEVDAALQGEKPSLRLVAIDLPMGAVRLFSPDLTAKPATAPAVQPKPIVSGHRQRPGSSGGPGGAGGPALGGVLVSPPTCTHAGVFHDGGTNGPPNP